MRIFTGIVALCQILLKLYLFSLTLLKTITSMLKIWIYSTLNLHSAHWCQWEGTTLWKYPGPHQQAEHSQGRLHVAARDNYVVAPHTNTLRTDTIAAAKWAFMILSNLMISCLGLWGKCHKGSSLFQSRPIYKALWLLQCCFFTGVKQSDTRKI